MERLRNLISSLCRQHPEYYCLESLPYYAQAQCLPSELPTSKIIDNATEVFVEQSERRVVAVGTFFVVKYGRQIDLEEGQTMLYIRRHSNVPIPRVYALYSDPQTMKNYIVMERVGGRTLEEDWVSLNEIQKEVICTKIRQYIQDLRAISPPKTYCSIGNKPLRDNIFYTGPKELSLGIDGPFNTEEDLANALLQKCESSTALRGKSVYYRRHFPLVFRGHPPKWTHSDLQRKNIMVQRQGDKEIEITFLDWETAGCYPSYWEYCRAILACRRFSDDWHSWVDKMLEPFFIEWCLMSTLMSELR